jgi:hypothetical protein
LVKTETLDVAVCRWAEREPAVAALVLIGSRARTGAPAQFSPDEYSDWDFQIVTRRPTMLASAEWLHAAGIGEPLAYVQRSGRFGSAMKVTAVLHGGELDLVIIPSNQLVALKWLLRLRLARCIPSAWRGVSDLAVVLRAGYAFKKGERAWGAFFRRVATKIPLPRLDSAAVVALAEGFVCDYVSTRHKIARGELAAAQRWLHLQLAETNFRLRHELRQRRGELTLPDARRLEKLLDPQLVDALTIRALPTADALLAATKRSAVTLRDSMRELVGASWHWPDID